MSDETCNLKLQALEFKTQSLRESFMTSKTATEIRLTSLEKLAGDIKAVKFAAYGIIALLLAQTMGITELVKAFIFGV